MRCYISFSDCDINRSHACYVLTKLILFCMGANTEPGTNLILLESRSTQPTHHLVTDPPSTQNRKTKVTEPVLPNIFRQDSNFMSVFSLRLIKLCWINQESIIAMEIQEWAEHVCRKKKWNFGLNNLIQALA